MAGGVERAETERRHAGWDARSGYSRYVPSRVRLWRRPTGLGQMRREAQDSAGGTQRRVPRSARVPDRARHVRGPASDVAASGPT